MKRKMMALLTVILITTSAFADDVNYKILNNFNQSFKNVKNVKWNLTTEYVKVNFEVNGEKKVAVYNLDGELLAVSRAIEFKTIPVNAIEKINNKYLNANSPYKLMESIETIDGDNNTKYYVSFETNTEKLILEVSLEGWISQYSKKKK